MSNSGWSTKQDFKFSAGPWNLHPGADPFGPAVRPEREFVQKLKIFKELGFDYVQFHDDDAVPDEFSPAEREKKAKEVRKLLDDHGLKAEILYSPPFVEKFFTTYSTPHPPPLPPP